MEIKELEKEFQEKISKEITLIKEGVDRFRVFSPFMFEDGDHICMLLKKVGEDWMFTDEGHTLMHLSYDLDIKALEKGQRQKIISNTLSNYNIQDNEGELISRITNGNIGDVFYSFVQGLIKITDVTYLTKERVKSTFWEDFKELISNTVPEERREFNYFEIRHDPDKKYPIDCRINGMPKPVFVFAINNDDKCRDVTIGMLRYEKWGIPFQTLSIFEDQEMITRKVLARFSDVADKQFSSLASNKDRIEKYLLERLSNGG